MRSYQISYQQAMGERQIPKLILLMSAILKLLIMFDGIFGEFFEPQIFDIWPPNIEL